MSDEPPKVRTKAPRRPTRRSSGDQRPFNPMRDARIAAAFDRGDDDAALKEFLPMDPNEALKNAREAVQRYNNCNEHVLTRVKESEKLVEAFEALDGWISKGGFLPKDWSSFEDNRG